MSRAVVRPLSAVLLVVVAVGVTACLPQQRGKDVEVDDGVSAAPASPPKFPAAGPVPAALLVEGLVYDFSSVPTDLDLWAPPVGQARCAAQRIVSSLGADRLSELGYRPATSGASLNDIDLSSSERDSVAAQFQSCVDMTEGVASLLMGDGHMDSTQALCIAKGLKSKDLLAPFASAWAFGRTVDPFSGNAALTDALLSYSHVCLPDSAFTWNDSHLPGDDVIQGVGVDGTTTSTLPGTPDGLSSRTGSNTSTP